MGPTQRTGPLLAVLLWVGCGGDAGPATHLVAGQLLARFPEPTGSLEGSAEELIAAGLMLEDAASFDLFGDTVAIADRRAGRVQFFTLAGEHLGVLGGPEGDGTGPAVLSAPKIVRFLPDGSILVEDLGLRRVVRFSPAWEVVETVPMPTMLLSGHVAVDPVLGIVTGSTSPGSLLSVVGKEDERIASEVPVPEELALPKLQGDLGRLAPEVVSALLPETGSPFQLESAGRGEILLLDGPRLRLWQLRLDYGPARIVEIEKVDLPAWLLAHLRTAREETRRTWGGELAPFNDWRLAADGVWLEPGSDAGVGIRGVWLPLEEDDERGASVFWRTAAPEPRGRRSLIRDGVVHTLGRTSYARYELREVDSPP